MFVDVRTSRITYRTEVERMKDYIAIEAHKHYKRGCWGLSAQPCAQEALALVFITGYWFRMLAREYSHRRRLQQSTHPPYAGA